MHRLFYLPFFLSMLISCTTNSEVASKDAARYQQYYVQGQSLYQKHCSNCHQQNGKGLARLYPPLDNSDYMDQHLEETICIIKYGRSGALTVNGVDYNMEMKGNPTLTELEVAEIATYIYNTWNHQRGLIDVKGVSTILSKCNN